MAAQGVSLTEAQLVPPHPAKPAARSRWLQAGGGCPVPERTRVCQHAGCPSQSVRASGETGQERIMMKLVSTK